MRAPALLASSGILAQIAGIFLYGAPKGPDVPQGAAHLLGAFLVTLSALLSQVCWGNVLARARGRVVPLWEQFLWGTSLTLVLLAALGFVPGSVGEGAAVFWRVFLLAGCLGAIYLSRQAKAAPARAAPAFTDLAVGAVLLLAAAGAALPRPFWDSLWYELTAGRLWFDAGRVHLPPRLPVVLQGGLWDYQLLLGQLLLGGPQGGGLIAAQLFGQWSALACAAGAFLALRTSGGALGLTPFGALLGLVGSELFVEAEFAKNDWAVVLWGIAALVYMRERRYRAGALSAGLALSMKLTSAFFLVPWSLWLAWELRAEPLKLARRGGWLLLGASPMLLRNFLLTGNPFFPALASLFPSPLLGPSWAGLASYAVVLPGPAGWLAKLAWLARTSASVLGLAFLPLAWRSLPASGRAPLFVTLASLALLFFGMGAATEWRFAGAGLVLGAAYGAVAMELALARLGPVPAGRAVRALTVAALLWFPVDWKAPRELLSGRDSALLVREWVSGGAMAWVRMNAAPGTAAALNESRIYYLFPNEPRRAFDEPDLDRRLSEAKGPGDLPAIFRGAGIRYLVLSAEFVDRAYDRRVCDWAYLLSERNPQAVVYKASLSRVLDLGRLP